MLRPGTAAVAAAETVDIATNRRRDTILAPIDSVVTIRCSRWPRTTQHSPVCPRSIRRLSRSGKSSRPNFGDNAIKWPLTRCFATPVQGGKTFDKDVDHADRRVTGRSPLVLSSDRSRFTVRSLTSSTVARSATRATPPCSIASLQSRAIRFLRRKAALGSLRSWGFEIDHVTVT